MIYVTRIYHRKDSNTSWYIPSTVYREHLIKNYVDTKKVVKMVSEESNDKLSLIDLAIFANDEAKQEFQGDPICKEHMDTRQEYYITNAIVCEHPVIIEK
jgi:hypothetical protein